MARVLNGSIRRTTPDEDDMRDGITFDKLGRMEYHPDFHPNHGKPITLSEKIYIAKFYDTDGMRLVSFALAHGEDYRPPGIAYAQERRDGETSEHDRRRMAVHLRGGSRMTPDQKRRIFQRLKSLSNEKFWSAMNVLHTRAYAAAERHYQEAMEIV